MQGEWSLSQPAAFISHPCLKGQLLRSTWSHCQCIQNECNLIGHGWLLTNKGLVGLKSLNFVVEASC